MDDLLSESDSVRSFVRECVVACHRGEVAIQDLATDYRDDCEARDWEPLRERQFQTELPDGNCFLDSRFKMCEHWGC